MSLTLVRDAETAEREPRPRVPSIAELYDAHRDLVYRLGLRYGSGDPQWAEDIAHDVFLELFADPSCLEGVSNVAGWLYRVTTNRCLNVLRRERLVRSAPVRWLLETRSKAPVDPESLGIVDDRLRQVFVAVNAMPPNARACFFMYYVDGKNQVEIAEILGFTKSYVCKVLAQVKLRLHRLGLGEGAPW